jgi:nucleotide-binding universal stress UspA family protein
MNAERSDAPPGHLSSDMKTTQLNRKPTAVPQQSDTLEIRTILVPLDFSRASMQAVKYVIPLAEEFKAAVHLVHVQPTDDLTEISQAGHMMLNCTDAIAFMQDRLAEVQEKHDVQFWPDNCHVASGRPFQEICNVADKIGADLIVLPTRGHSGLKRIALGSTAERVVRHARCPVLIPRGKKFKAAIANGESAGKFSLRQVLVPVDFSECSLAGVKYAARLAKRFRAKLHLFHAVFPYAQMIAVDGMGGELRPLLESAQANAEEAMQKLQQSVFLRGVSCETEVRAGPAIDEICAASGRDNVDLVVTSTHGRGGFSHALMGSVAEHIVRYAECPVLVVPSRGGS